MERNSVLGGYEIQQRNSTGKMPLNVPSRVVDIADIISPPLDSSPYKFSIKIIELFFDGGF